MTGLAAFRWSGRWVLGKLGVDGLLSELIETLSLGGDVQSRNERFIERLQGIKEDFGKGLKKSDPRLRPGELVVPSVKQPEPAPVPEAVTSEPPATSDDHPETP